MHELRIERRFFASHALRLYDGAYEPTHEPEHPGWYYAHVPTFDLTTHGEGVDGATRAARDLIEWWVAERGLTTFQHS